MTSISDSEAGLAGDWFEAGRSKPAPARLSRHGDALEVRLAERSLRAGIDEVQASPRLASVPRRLEFPGMGTFATLDNDGVDRLLRGRERRRGESFVDRLERRWGWALAALAALPLCLWALFTWGLPLVTTPLAHAVPDRVVDQLDDALLGALEDQILEPSALPPEQAAAVRAVGRRLGVETSIDLLVRGGGLLGANALALPGGTVIITDELVDTLRFEGELAAVIAHEAAHVEHRHGLRNLIQTVGAATVLGWMFGDLSFVTDLALVSAPTILQQFSYSREFEREADAEARDLLRARGIPVACMASLMERLRDRQKVAAGTLPGFLQTHPGFQARIDAALGGPPCDGATLGGT